jgi:hypothetical protein
VRFPRSAPWSACIPARGCSSGARAPPPRTLLRALEDRAGLSAGAQLVHFLTDGAVAGGSSSFRHRVFYVGADVRPLAAAGQIEYVPISLTEVPALVRSGRLPVDVALVQVSPPDDDGMCSLGVSVDVTRAAVLAARMVVAEVNPRMPRTHGDSLVPLDRLDHLVAVDTPVIEYEHPAVGEAAERIARYVDRDSRAAYPPVWHRRAGGPRVSMRETRVALFRVLGVRGERERAAVRGGDHCPSLRRFAGMELEAPSDRSGRSGLRGDTEPLLDPGRAPPPGRGRGRRQGRDLLRARSNGSERHNRHPLVVGGLDASPDLSEKPLALSLGPTGDGRTPCRGARRARRRSRARTHVADVNHASFPATGGGRKSEYASPMVPRTRPPAEREPGDCRVDERRARGFVGDVCRDEDGVAACPDGRLDDGTVAVEVPPVHGDTRALARAQDRDLAADARGRPGETCFARESHACEGMRHSPNVDVVSRDTLALWWASVRRRTHR